MSEKKRTPYQQEMDELHVPEEKANETLKLMLAENRRLREKDVARERRGFSLSPGKIGGFALAAAACVALLVAFLPRGNNSNYSFMTIDSYALPVIGEYRDGSENELNLSEAFGVTAEGLFPGWEVKEEKTELISTEPEELYISRLALQRDAQMLNAEITNFIPPLYQTVTEEQHLNDRPIRLARDEERQMVFAAYQQDDLYIVLSAKMSEESMLQVLRELLKLLK